MNKLLGFLFVAVGMCFFMLTLTMNIQNVTWAVMLGVSIVSNIAGTTLLFRNKQFNCFYSVEKSKLLSVRGRVCFNIKN